MAASAAVRVQSFLGHRWVVDQELSLAVATRAVVVVVSTRVVDIGALATDIVAVTRDMADIELRWLLIITLEDPV